MKRMYLELTKFTDNQLASLKEDLNSEGKARASKSLRARYYPNVRALVPMNKCVMMVKPPGGAWWERKPE